MRKRSDFSYIIGVDEVGRGPLAGPVSVCAVCIPKGLSKRNFQGVKDSKKLSASRRQEWSVRLKQDRKDNRINYAIASTGSRRIDELGIVRAIHCALTRALRRLEVDPERCLVLLDGGLKAPAIFAHQKTIIRGEEKEFSIALASIIAKVSRDQKMVRLALEYPHYGFEVHKGYGTVMHRRRIKRFGPCKIHRRTFCHI